MDELRAGTGLRLARAAVVAGVAIALGLVAHVSAGGLLPRLEWVVLGAVALLAATSTFLAGPASTWRLVALVGGGQLLTHLMLTATAGHAGDHSTAGADSGNGGASARLAALENLGEHRRGSLYDLTMGAASTAGSGQSGSDGFVVLHWVTHIVDDLTGPHAAMAVAHLIAAGAVACWLAVGEHALWLLICCLGAAVLSATGVLAHTPAPLPLRSLRLAARRSHAWVRLPLPPPLLGAQARRGPPAAAA